MLWVTTLQSPAALYPDHLLHHLVCPPCHQQHRAFDHTEHYQPSALSSQGRETLPSDHTTDMDSTDTTRSLSANHSISIAAAQIAEDEKKIKETFKNSQTPKHQKCFCIPVNHLHRQLKTSLLHLPPTTFPHLDVFVGRRFLVILFVFLKLSQFFLCLQLFKSHSSFLKS